MSRLPKHLFCLTADFKQYTLHKGWPEPYAYTVCDCILFWSLLGLATIVCLYLYMVNIRYFKQGNHHTHGSGQPSSLSNGISSREITIHTVLANPRHCRTVFQAGKSPYTRFWPTLVIVDSVSSGPRGKGGAFEDVECHFFDGHMARVGQNRLYMHHIWLYTWWYPCQI